jgi:hypothetical protein
LAHRDRVYDNVFKAAKNHKRLWTMMYDLTGLNKGDIAKYVIPDFKNMIDQRKFKDHPTLMHHNGKPLISIWGIGFNDGRGYSLKECMELVKFFKEDPVYGGFSVLIGVPYYWRSQTRDTMDDPLFMDIVKTADIIHPWSPGRYQKPEQMKGLQKTILEPDMKWAKDHNLDYMPVIFPGFSWHNLEKAKGQHAELNSIPRLGGQFVWSQAVAAKRAGANMIYLAMFDEMNEGTCFFKVSKRTPKGKSPFISYDIDGLQPDHYLWLSGQIRNMIRDEISATDRVPAREKK